MLQGGGAISAWLQIAVFVHTSFFRPMITRAFSQNVSKVISEFKLVTDNLPRSSFMQQPTEKPLKKRQY